MDVSREQGQSEGDSSPRVERDDMSELPAEVVDELRLAKNDHRSQREALKFKNRFSSPGRAPASRLVLIAIWDSACCCAWCTEVAVDADSEFMRSSDTTQSTYSLCSQCQGSGVCAYCDGDAPQTQQMCPCWWWEERGFDEALMGRCGECGGSGVNELSERRQVG